MFVIIIRNTGYISIVIGFDKIGVMGLQKMRRSGNILRDLNNE